MKRRVHLFCTVRIPVDIEDAETPEQAIKDAVETCAFEEILNPGEVEWAEEIREALVDELTDAGELVDGNSWWFRPVDGEPVRIELDDPWHMESCSF